jgi:putative ABC transport system permease protein
MVSRAIAEKMGTQVGEIYIAYDRRAMRRYEADPARLTLRVAGVWEPANRNAQFWDYVQIPPDNTLIVSIDAFAQRVGPALTDEIYQALWYMPMDASEIYASDVNPLLTRLRTLERAVEVILPSTTVDVSPIKALEQYRSAANLLGVMLLVSSVPVVGLVLAFVALIATLNAERQRNQIAVLRSRGATTGQIAGIAAMEGTVLGAAALALAIPLSLVFSSLMGQTRSFLNFTLRTDFRVGVTWPTLLFGALSMALSVLTQIAPSIGAARHTLVTYKQEQARTLRPPWWQRAWLDGLLLIPAVYGTYVLAQQGSLLGIVDVAEADPFSNPLLFLVPALTIVALALILLRLLPLLLRLVAGLSVYTSSVSLLMASRQLARASALHTAPLGLLILTLALSTYTASMAATMDDHLFDQQNYRVGSDVSLVDTGEGVNTSDVTIGSLGGAGGGEAALWRFPPVSDYLGLPGVLRAARVGRYDARIQTTGGFVPGAYIGVDRVDFAPVAFWREDFALEPLGSLMNGLAESLDGVLLPRAFMTEQILNVGDRVAFTIQAYDRSVTVQARVVGGFDYFPTWYPDSGPLVVGNLDHFFLQAQAELPYRVWMRTVADVDHVELAESVVQMNLGAEAMMVAQRSIAAEQRRPEHQGLLGLLSVGFSAAAVLTALGFMLYGLSSFRRRSVELGVLRATGLRSRHVAGIIGWELAMLLGVGGAAGTGLGIWASRLYVPFLQLGTGAAARVPPYNVAIAWPALLRLYALFALLFVVALAVLVRQIVRLQLFQAIKLGETV